jgi:2-amino-4-hydroxy-6-hydroxymethyldihydropteridine diphosphokinase
VSRIAYVGLGSNLGDREENLRAALTQLERHGLEVEAVSSLYETEPIGEILDQPEFLNAVARIRTSLQPEGVLDVCKGIEAEGGRMFAAPRHGPRRIDLDLLLFGDLEVSSERLTIPHPELTTRRFVLVPLLELDPELTLPDGASRADALEALGSGQRVERVGALA